MKKFIAYHKMDVDTQVAVMIDIGEHYMNHDDEGKETYQYGWTKYGLQVHEVDALIDLYVDVLRKSYNKEEAQHLNHLLTQEMVYCIYKKVFGRAKITLVKRECVKFVLRSC